MSVLQWGDTQNSSIYTSILKYLLHRTEWSPLWMWAIIIWNHQMFNSSIQSLTPKRKPTAYLYSILCKIWCPIISICSDFISKSSGLARWKPLWEHSKFFPQEINLLTLPESCLFRRGMPNGLQVCMLLWKKANRNSQLSPSPTCRDLQNLWWNSYTLSVTVSMMVLDKPTPS